jgi:hypothetical protein
LETIAQSSIGSKLPKTAAISRRLPLCHHQTQPAGIGAKAIGRENEKDSRGARLEIPEGKIPASEDRGHAETIEELRVALHG